VINLKSKKNTKINLIILSSIFLVFLGFFAFYFDNYKVVEIDGHKFSVELALTSQKQSLGLGGRKSIKDNQGMLFDFKREGEWSFWMKDMRFDLDIIWIENKKIVYISRNTKYDYPGIISPKVKADKALEIKAGLSDKYGFKEGDQIKIY
jgi:uncharacterized protein